jgi:hypothetical protein
MIILLAVAHSFDWRVAQRDFTQRSFLFCLDVIVGLTRTEQIVGPSGERNSKAKG